MISFLLALAVMVEGEVISVTDGDTLKVRTAEGETKVRLACIDAMERSQPGGAASTVALQVLLAPGDKVQVLTHKKDVYGRAIALIWKDGQLLNLEQVASGNAVIYSQFFRPCLYMLEDFNQAQKAAENLNLGFWSWPENKRVYPWVWRKQK